MNYANVPMMEGNATPALLKKRVLFGGLKSSAKSYTSTNQVLLNVLIIFTGLKFLKKRLCSKYPKKVAKKERRKEGEKIREEQKERRRESYR